MSGRIVPFLIVAALAIPGFCWLTLPLATSREKASAPGSGQNNTGLVTMSGHQLLRDGVPWVPKAVNMDAITAPWPWLEAHASSPADPLYVQYLAWKNWAAHTQVVIDATYSFGADSVRLLVSQGGMQSSQYGEDYYNQVKGMVGALRDRGLTVSIGVQWEPHAGIVSPSMPTTDTISVLKKLARIAGNDQGVMIELFN